MEKKLVVCCRCLCACVGGKQVEVVLQVQQHGAVLSPVFHEHIVVVVSILQCVLCLYRARSRRGSLVEVVLL